MARNSSIRASLRANAELISMNNYLDPSRDAVIASEAKQSRACPVVPHTLIATPSSPAARDDSGSETARAAIIPADESADLFVVIARSEATKQSPARLQEIASLRSQ